MTVDDSLEEEISLVEEAILDSHTSDQKSLWKDYLAARKQEFILSSIESIGAEYHDNRRFWDAQFEREWAVAAERLSAGFGVTDEIVKLLGQDFFQTTEELSLEIEQFESEVETEIVGIGNCVRVYDWEDFLALHRQGIFREAEFVLRLGSKWRKNMIRELREVWGYSPVGEFPLGGERHLILQRIEGGGGFTDQ